MIPYKHYLTQKGRKLNFSLEFLTGLFCNFRKGKIDHFRASQNQTGAQCCPLLNPLKSLETTIGPFFPKKWLCNKSPCCSKLDIHFFKPFNSHKSCKEKNTPFFHYSETNNKLLVKLLTRKIIFIFLLYDLILKYCMM